MPRRTRPTPPLDTDAPRATRLFRLVLPTAAVLWAATWSAFVVASVQGEPWRGWVIGGGFCAGVWLLALGAWWRPRLGGLVMVAAGVWSETFFHSRAAMLGLTIPAIVLGTAFMLRGIRAARRERRALRALIAERAAAAKAAQDTHTPEARTNDA